MKLWEYASLRVGWLSGGSGSVARRGTGRVTQGN